MLKKSKFKKIMATSVMALMMAGAIDSGILGMRQVYVHAATVEAGVHQNLRMPVSTNVIDEAIQRTCKAVVNTHFSMDWTAIGLDKAGNRDMISSDYLAKTTQYLKDNEHKVLQPTDYERITLGVLAAGGDPTNVNGSGINLIEKIRNADFEGQGINALVFGLIALNAGNYTIPEEKEKGMIKGILDKQVDGGWAFFGDKADPDMTGMTMTALAKYNNKDHKDVQEAINKAVNRLSELQLHEGCEVNDKKVEDTDDFGAYQSWNTINSQSCAQVIMGLCTNGIDPHKDPRFIKNGRSVVDAFLSFELDKTGIFQYMRNETPNGMATEQALYALDEYKLFVDTKEKASKDQIDENGNLKTLRPTIYNWAK